MKKIFGILAHPAGHSLSPQMQSAAFAEKGIHADFLRFDIPPSDLLEFIRRVRLEHISGLAVSLPHKEAIIPYLDELTDTAKKIGAVNTVFWKNGKLCGDNTDAPGFFRAIEPIFSTLPHPRCAVIGAGGAARAIVSALKNVGADVTIFNRTSEKADLLAKEFGADSKSLSSFSAKDFDLVINSTSVGLREEKSPVAKDSWIEFTGTAFDAVFSPLKTLFLRDAESAGAQIITGEKMLLYQGILQFSLWTGFSAPEGIMRVVLEKCVSKDY